MTMVGVDTGVSGPASHKRRHDKEVGLGCGNPIGTNMEAQSISHIYHDSLLVILHSIPHSRKSLGSRLTEKQSARAVR